MTHDQIMIRWSSNEMHCLLEFAKETKCIKADDIYGSIQQRPGLDFAKTNLFSAGKNILFVFREFANQVVDHSGAHPYHDGDEDEDDDDVLGLGEVDGDASALS